MGSTDYSTALDIWWVPANTQTLIPLRKVHNGESNSNVRLKMCLFRGAGCIFIEMLQGSPAFPGVADVFEQLLKIWTVRLYYNCVKFLFYSFIYPPLLPLFISPLLSFWGPRGPDRGELARCQWSAELQTRCVQNPSFICLRTVISQMCLLWEVISCLNRFVSFIKCLCQGMLVT